MSRIGFGVGWLTLFSSVLWAEPRAKFDETVFEFGLLPQGTTVQHSFSFRNTGDQPLRIEGVQSTCGCTAAAPSDPVVAPGKTAEIKVTYDSAGRSGPTAKQVRVRTNDPKNPLTLLTISGEVGPPTLGAGEGAREETACSTCPQRQTKEPAPTDSHSNPEVNP